MRRLCGATNASQGTHMTPKHAPATPLVQAHVGLNLGRCCEHSHSHQNRLFTPVFTRSNAPVNASRRVLDVPQVMPCALAPLYWPSRAPKAPKQPPPAPKHASNPLYRAGWCELGRLITTKIKGTFAGDHLLPPSASPNSPEPP